MMLEAPLVRPTSTINGADVANCQMTRSELQKRLAECAFGRNHVIFDSYFRWSEGTSGQPYCNVCFRPIGVHGDGAAAAAPPPPPPTATPAPPPAAPVAQQPHPGYLPPQAVQMYPGYPPPPVMGYPTHMYQPPSYPPAYAMYAYNVAPQQVGVPYPAKMVPGDGGGVGDAVFERYEGVNVVLSTVFGFFFLTFLCSAIGILRKDDGDDDRSSTSGNRNAYVFAVAGASLLVCSFFAYRTSKFTLRVFRGERVISEEYRLLTMFFTSNKRIMNWSGVVAGATVEVVTDPTSNRMFGCYPQRVLIVLRPVAAGPTSSAGQQQQPVLLARCPPGLVDVEVRAWMTYFEVLRQTYRPRHE